MTVDQHPRPALTGDQPSIAPSRQHDRGVAAGPGDVERIATAILGAVEQQLSRYFTATSQQAEATRAAIEGQRTANERYQQALQRALEERLAEFADHQHRRMCDVEEKVALAGGPGSHAPAALDPEAVLEIRQTVRDDMERSFAAINARLDELGGLQRRQDEYASAIVQHVNDTTTALTVRMDEGDQRLGHAVEERLNAFAGDLAASFDSVADQVNEHTNSLMLKLDSVESRATDRLLELEQRLKEEEGQKIANLEATIGRIGSGFDDAMVAVSQRVLELENRLYDLDDRIGEIGARLGKVDENALEEIRGEMSRAVGEAMLVRIELERVATDVDEKLDRTVIRMSEIEGLLTDQMDVSTAVQLERIDELERQMELLDPSRFGRVDAAATPPTAAAPAPAAAAAHAAADAPDASNPSLGTLGTLSRLGTLGGGDAASARPAAVPGPPSMTLNPRLMGADTPAESAADHPDLTSH